MRRLQRHGHRIKSAWAAANKAGREYAVIQTILKKEY